MKKVFSGSILAIIVFLSIAIVGFALEKKEPATYKDMARIPAGKFEMGYEDVGALKSTQPEHPVYVNALHINKYAVTNAQYREFVLANPEWQKENIVDRFHDGNYLKDWSDENSHPDGKENHPVTYVSWYAAMAYAQWAGKRLPTEAEWEKAARGGLEGQLFPWGDSIDLSRGNYFESAVGGTTPVGTYPANGYGLYDMAGNVWEWCLDEYDSTFYKEFPRKRPRNNPIAGADSITEMIIKFKDIKSRRSTRGGSWQNKERPQSVHSRVAYRPNRTSPAIGFRCVKDATH